MRGNMDICFDTPLFSFPFLPGATTFETSCLPSLTTNSFLNGISSLMHPQKQITVKILKFGTPQTIAIIVLKIEKFDVTLH